jgi:hypothetical protein
MTALAGVAATIGIAVAVPSSASAVIGPTTVLAGPSASILGVGNAALASDGTGGVVWRQLEGGVPHIFASRFQDGSWSAPIEVDAGQPGPATFPAIAAGDGGELLVVWVAPWVSESVGDQPPTTHYQLMSSVLQPGTAGFGAPMQVDPNDVGDGSGVFPSLAMAPDGSAYVVYRVVTNPLTPGVTQPPGTIAPMHAGDELVDVRVAQFNGLYWSALGAVNRAPGQVTMRKPTDANAPVITIDRAGDALVAWQEPDINGVARIWARRIYGTQPGYVLQASPDTISGKPVTVDADAPSLSFGNFASAALAFRLAGGAGNPLGTAHVFINTLQDEFTSGAAAFAGAVPIAGAPGIGQPSVSVDDNGDYQAGFTAGGASELVTGTQTTTGTPQDLGSADGDPALAALDPDGGGATVWPSADGDGRPVVCVRDALPDGGMQTAALTAPVSGPIGSLTIGASGEGDALIAFQQGLSSTSQVVVSAVQAPPHSFFPYTPFTWVKPTAAAVSWGQATSVIGSVTYAVLVDGQTKIRGLRGLRYRLPAAGLGEGKHRIRIIATDSAGQETFSGTASIRVDGTPPAVTVRRLSHGRVRVLVHDSGSGARRSATVIGFGDGTRAVRGAVRATHAYRAPGRYTITVRCADKIGNRAVDHILVAVR